MGKNPVQGLSIARPAVSRHNPLACPNASSVHGDRSVSSSSLPSDAPESAASRCARRSGVEAGPSPWCHIPENKTPWAVSRCGCGHRTFPDPGPSNPLAGLRTRRRRTCHLHERVSPGPDQPAAIWRFLHTRTRAAAGEQWQSRQTGCCIHGNSRHRFPDPRTVLTLSGVPFMLKAPEYHPRRCLEQSDPRQDCTWQDQPARQTARALPILTCTAGPSRGLTESSRQTSPAHRDYTSFASFITLT